MGARDGWDQVLVHGGAPGHWTVRIPLAQEPDLAGGTVTALGSLQDHGQAEVDATHLRPIDCSVLTCKKHNQELSDIRYHV